MCGDGVRVVPQEFDGIMEVVDGCSANCESEEGLSCYDANLPAECGARRQTISPVGGLDACYNACAPVGAAPAGIAPVPNAVSLEDGSACSRADEEVEVEVEAHLALRQAGGDDRGEG